MSVLGRHRQTELEAIRAQSLWKTERPIVSPQEATSGSPAVAKRARCSISAPTTIWALPIIPTLIEAAKLAMDTHGLGMASVRFICGTTDLHRELEAKIADYVGMRMLFSMPRASMPMAACSSRCSASKDAIVSDSLNHASIIDGIRLSKAKRYRYRNGDMDDLEAQLKAAREARAPGGSIIVTDGVFSMDGYLAKLGEIRKLADAHERMVMVDDCHATGFIGPQGRGTPARSGVKVDILTGTLGKALGGSTGGFMAAAKPIVDLLRQRSRPYLFSNALPPPWCSARPSRRSILRAQGDDLRNGLFDNARRFRTAMGKAGFNLLAGEHPIIPVMLGEAKLAQDMAAKLYERGIYVTGFFYPVVPQGAGPHPHPDVGGPFTPQDIDAAVAAFTEVGKELGVI